MQISKTSLIMNDLMQNRSENKNNKQPEVENGKGAYTLDLSEAAQKYLQLSSSDGLRTSLKQTDTAKTGVDLQKEIEDTQNMLRRFMLAHNIDPTADYEFEIDDNGRIAITNDIADKNEIEEKLNADNSLANALKKTLADSEAEAHLKVQQQYTQLLEDDDNKDDEEKKQLLYEKAVAAQKQIEAAAGKFSMSGGTMNIASLSMAGNIM